MEANKEYKFQLIEGDFTPTEALKILMSVINSKIKFHQLDSFSNQIRFNSDASHSKKRIEALTESNEAIKKIIKEAEDKGMKLKINSTIEIVLTQ
ncbi:hypothetical protein [Flavobacterium luteum]|uniref:Uncharacterized protein n=1 Tax=Flavobacterium luteum TaxID=2026654 RepID=A0A7J5AL08_9FLAO|nr:hypothetical protein [Flavobacterium luteum]KAB1157659.1 hypothetical protein F6464_00830 [Flavobacterium luteum]